MRQEALTMLVVILFMALGLVKAFELIDWFVTEVLPQWL